MLWEGPRRPARRPRRTTPHAPHSTLHTLRSTLHAQPSSGSVCASGVSVGTGASPLSLLTSCLPPRVPELMEPRVLGEPRAGAAPQKVPGSPEGGVCITLTPMRPNRTPGPAGPQPSLSGSSQQEARVPVTSPTPARGQSLGVTPGGGVRGWDYGHARGRESGPGGSWCLHVACAWVSTCVPVHVYVCVSVPTLSHPCIPSSRLALSGRRPQTVPRILPALLDGAAWLRPALGAVVPVGAPLGE